MINEDIYFWEGGGANLKLAVSILPFLSDINLKHTFALRK